MNGANGFSEGKTDITARDCNLWYGDYHALHDINIEIPEKKVTALIGPSGCGKSTLLSLINGVIPRMTSGTLDGKVLVDGEDVAGHSMSRISRKVGCVLQNAESQIIHQSAEDEIAFGCENFGIDPKEIDRRKAQIKKGHGNPHAVGRTKAEACHGLHARHGCKHLNI